MKLTSESKLFMGIFAVTAIAIGFAVWAFSQPQKPIDRTALAPASAPSKGPSTAKTYLVEFSDFQCPACKLFSGPAEELMKKYPDRLQIVYRYFPLDQHPQAVPSALAAGAAGRQGKFFEMYALLFENQDTLSPELYPKLATQLGLDAEKFAQDMNDPALKTAIMADRTYGESIGIDATPTFFLDGRKLELSSTKDLVAAVSAAVESAK